MKRITRIIDTVFIALVFFMVNKLWFAYRLSDSRASTFYAVINTAIFGAILILVLRRYYHNKKQKEEQLRQIERARQTLELYSAKKYYQFMNSVIKAYSPDSRRLSGDFYLTPNREIILLTSQNYNQPTDNVLIIKAMLKLKAEKIIIFSPILHAETIPLFPCEIIKMDKVMKLIEKSDIEFHIREFPAFKKERIPFFARLKNGIQSGSPAKNVFYALFWAFAAFTTRYGIYYLVISLIYACIGLYSYYLKSRSKKIF